MSLHPDIERCALLGWRMYPYSRVSKAGCITNGTDLATHNLDQLEQWSAQFPRCNWRVVMDGSGIWALDCDTPPLHKHDGVGNFAKLVREHEPLPPRPTARSGGGGIILFWRHTDEQIIGDGNHPVDGVDPRRGRQSQTIPPSTHVETRQPYRWVIAPWEVAPPPTPAWLLAKLKPPPAPVYRPVESNEDGYRRLMRAASRISVAQAGDRNGTLNKQAFGIGILIREGKLGAQEASDTLYSAALSAGLSHSEIKATLKSGLEAGMRHA